MAKKILIAEDEKPIARALAAKLKNSGYNPINAFNGEEAVKMIAEDKFDLILLDLVMPKFDGFEVLKKFKEEGNTTPVIILSNLGQNEDIVKAKELGAKDYFVKADTPLSKIVEYIKNLLK